MLDIKVFYEEILSIFRIHHTVCIVFQCMYF